MVGNKYQTGIRCKYRNYLENGQEINNGEECEKFNYLINGLNRYLQSNVDAICSKCYKYKPSIFGIEK